MNLVPKEIFSLSTKLNQRRPTAQDFLEELIRVNNSTTKQITQNNQVLSDLYHSNQFNKSTNQIVQQSSFLHEPTQDEFHQTIQPLSSPGIIQPKQDFTPFEQSLIFTNKNDYDLLANDEKIISFFSQIYLTYENSKFVTNNKGLLSKLSNKHNLCDLFNQTIEILNPFKLCEVNRGKQTNEQLFWYQNNLISADVDRNNIYPNRRKQIGKYYWPQISIYSIHTLSNLQTKELLAYSTFKNIDFIKQIFGTKYKLELKK